VTQDLLHGDLLTQEGRSEMGTGTFISDRFSSPREKKAPE
jgi:hypothetical protein